jgi:hypothetical protein
MYCNDKVIGDYLFATMLFGYARVSTQSERAIAALREHGIPIERESLAHLSPIGWEHVNLTGDYTWQSTGPLRRARSGPYDHLQPQTSGPNC